MKRNSAEDLNPAELEVLGILWNESPLKPSQIEEEFSRPIENATLRSILRALLEKGYVKRKRVGKAYHYRPVRAARTVRRNLTGRLASVFAEGSRLGLIAQLIADEKLGPEEIAELRQLVDNKSDE